ncbi:hypothetical protein GOV12_01350 [Candidatus Pacearchaeota archaeon]|nr:hypothetical protein [Candidatus Pacearchaeota archaeon]
MDNLDINYQEIDEGIRDLVCTLNQIQYVTTQTSCEGHLRDDSGRTEFFPDQGHKFLYRGDMIFKVDVQHPNAQQFLSDVQQLKRRYFFVELYEHHCGDEDCSIEGYQVLNLGYCDLIRPKTINNYDILEVIVKKKHQVKTSVGMHRIRDYQRVWTDFLAIAERYVE